MTGKETEDVYKRQLLQNPMPDPMQAIYEPQPSATEITTC